MKKDRIDIIIKKILYFFKIKIANKKEQLLVQIVKFIIIGGIATILDWILYFILYNYIKLEPLMANIISYAISTIYNYIASVKLVFNVNKNNGKKKNFIIFITLSLIGLLISEGLIYLMINIIYISKMISKIISIVIVMIFNFITKKYFLEKKFKLI